MTITRNVTMADGTQVQLEIKLTDDEIEKAYREQEAHYYYEDVVDFLEQIDSDVSADCVWEEMYDDYLYNTDCNLSYWDNMQNTFDYVMEMSGYRKEKLI